TTPGPGATPQAERADPRGRVCEGGWRGSALTAHADSRSKLPALSRRQIDPGTGLDGHRLGRHQPDDPEARFYRSDAVCLDAVHRPRRSNVYRGKLSTGVGPRSIGRNVPTVPGAAGLF